MFKRDKNWKCHRKARFLSQTITLTLSGGHTTWEVLQACQIDDCWNVDGDRVQSGQWTGFGQFTLFNNPEHPFCLVSVVFCVSFLMHWRALLAMISVPSIAEIAVPVNNKTSTVKTYSTSVFLRVIPFFAHCKIRPPGRSLPLSSLIFAMLRICALLCFFFSAASWSSVCFFTLDL